MDLISIMADFPEAQSLEIFSEIAGNKKTIEETAGNTRSFSKTKQGSGCDTSC